jgi:ribA/ribD-fused uncharacterized protein
MSLENKMIITDSVIKDLMERLQMVKLHIQVPEDSFTFFWRTFSNHGYLSNWYPCKFTLNGTLYNCSEQYMMEQKAILFDDQITKNMIMNANHPREQKSLGRKVKNFDWHVWWEHCERIMMSGILAKFQQNAELAHSLLSTGETILVEASPYDNVWGIGLNATNPRAKDMHRWKGENILGFLLMVVRDCLRETME